MILRLAVLVFMLLVSLLVAACGRPEATPLPTPTATPAPTATPTPVPTAPDKLVPAGSNLVAELQVAKILGDPDLASLFESFFESLP